MTPEWQQAVDSWIAGRRSPQTRRSYALALERWSAYTEQHHVDLATAGPTHLANWMQSLHGVCAVNSIRQRLSAISAFYDWQARHMRPPIRTDNPTRSIAWPAPQIPRRSASERTVDAEQAGMLLDQANVRDRALVALMCVEALRCAEVCSLRWSDYTPPSLWVTGKGGKRRFIQPAEVTADLLDEWHAENTGAYMFPGRDGSGPLTTRAAYNVVRNLGRAIGVDISPHPLRASAITLMLAGGAQLHEAQRAAGHASPATTERYIKKEAPRASSKTGIKRPKRQC